MTRIRLSAFALALAVILADQWSKWCVMVRYFKFSDVGFADWLLQKGGQAQYKAEALTDWLNIVMVWNPGVSFGMLQTNKMIVTYALSAMAVLVSIGFFVWLWREPKTLRAAAVGLICGGALGNVWDRLRFNAVADFIDVHIGTHHWPAFNLADSAISVGVLMLLVEIFVFSEGEK